MWPHTGWGRVPVGAFLYSVILWVPCHISLVLLVLRPLSSLSSLAPWCQCSVLFWQYCMLPCHLTTRPLFWLWIKPSSLPIHSGFQAGEWFLLSLWSPSHRCFCASDHCCCETIRKIMFHSSDSLCDSRQSCSLSPFTLSLAKQQLLSVSLKWWLNNNIIIFHLQAQIFSHLPCLSRQRTVSVWVQGEEGICTVTYVIRSRRLTLIPALFPLFLGLLHYLHWHHGLTALAGWLEDAVGSEGVWRFAALNPIPALHFPR